MTDGGGGIGRVDDVFTHTKNEFSENFISPNWKFVPQY